MAWWNLSRHCFVCGRKGSRIPDKNGWRQWRVALAQGRGIVSGDAGPPAARLAALIEVVD